MEAELKVLLISLVQKVLGPRSTKGPRKSLHCFFRLPASATEKPPSSLLPTSLVLLCAPKLGMRQWSCPPSSPCCHWHAWEQRWGSSPRQFHCLISGYGVGAGWWDMLLSSSPTNAMEASHTCFWTLLSCWNHCPTLDVSAFVNTAWGRADVGIRNSVKRVQ